MFVRFSVHDSTCPSNTATLAAFFSKSGPTPGPPPAAAGGLPYTAADDQLLPAEGPLLLLLLEVLVLPVKGERSSSDGRVICTSGPCKDACNQVDGKGCVCRGC